MNTEPKVRLSLVIPGATMLSSRDCEKMSKKDVYDHHVIQVVTKVKQGKKIIHKKENIHFTTTKNRPAKQNMSISREAYNYMTSSDIPSDKMKKVWGHMSKKSRLEYHFDIIAEHFNALSYTYEILED